MTLWTKDGAVQRIVTRDIPISDRGMVATLNDVPRWMVEEARAIARESLISAVRYLRFYVAKQHVSSAEDFVEDVLLGEQQAQTWKIRDCIFIPTETYPVSAIESRAYLNSLASMDGEHWFRVSPAQTDSLWDYIPGMVGVVQRNTRYWHATPSGITRYPFTQPGNVEFVSSDQLESTIRRWIAHRLAWWAREHLEQHRATPAALTGDGILAAVPDAGPSHATSDARIAASALAREALAYRDSHDFPQRAGFLGLDEWYAPSTPS
jgi:hypothetical protein